MKKISYDKNGNIQAIYDRHVEIDGVLIEDTLVDEIMSNPLGFRVENEKIVETGYEPETIGRPTEGERIEELENIVNLILMGGL